MNLVAVVGEDDVDEVLADVVHVALHRREHDAALAAGCRPCSMNCSRWATDIFIVSADCSTNGSCISPDAKSSPTTFMPESSTSLMMSSGGQAVGPRLFEVVDQAVALAVDDPVLQPFLDRPARAVLAFGLDLLDVLEDLEQLAAAGRSRRVAGPTPGRARPRAARRGCG